jgi:hypothetical protein
MANEADRRSFLTIFLIMVVATVLIALGIAIWVPGDPALKLRLAITYGLLVLIFLFGFVILAAIASGRIDITDLLEEETGGASTSRFQLLVFTFVIGLSFVLIVASSSSFPEVPANVLALLGISASTYGVSKGIQAGARNETSGNNASTSPTTSTTTQSSTGATKT